MDKKIVDYDILHDPSEERLMKSVKEKMKEGWQPLGSVVIGSKAAGFTGTQSHTLQAMVEYED